MGHFVMHPCILLLVAGCVLSASSPSEEEAVLLPDVVADAKIIAQVGESVVSIDTPVIIKEIIQDNATTTRTLVVSSNQSTVSPLASSNAAVPAAADSLADIPVFMINLARRPDRLKYTVEALRRSGITEVERFEAVDGETLDITSPDLLTARARWELDTPRQNDVQIGSKGALGCYMSHVRLWERIIERNISMAIIFEDDVVVSEEFWPQLADVLNKIKNQPNVTAPMTSLDGILLGWLKMIDPPKKTGVPGLSRLSGRFWGTQAYLITREGAIAMKQHALPINMQIDAHIAVQSYLRSHMHFYLPETPIAAQQWFATSNVWVACESCQGESGYFLPWGWGCAWTILTVALATLAWQTTFKTKAFALVSSSKQDDLLGNTKQ